MFRKILFLSSFFVLFAIGGIPSLLAQEESTQKLTAAIVYVEGTVTVNITGEDWIPAEKDMTLFEDSMIRTAENSYCDIAFDKEKKNVMSLGSNTEMVIGQALKQTKILKGRVYSILKGLDGSEFKVITPQAIAGVRGTAWESVVDKDVSFNVTDSTIYVEGVDPAGDKVGQKDVTAGFSLAVDTTGRLGDIAKISDEEMQRLEQWSNRIEQTLTLAKKKRHDCEQLIRSYKGESKNLFEQVMNCEAQFNGEGFAALGGEDLVAFNGNDPEQGITGDEILRTTTFLGLGDISAPSVIEPPAGGDNPPGGGEEPPPCQPRPCPAHDPFCGCD